MAMQWGCKRDFSCIFAYEIILAAPYLDWAILDLHPHKSKFTIFENMLLFWNKVLTRKTLLIGICFQILYHLISHHLLLEKLEVIVAMHYGSNIWVHYGALIFVEQFWLLSENHVTFAFFCRLELEPGNFTCNLRLTFKMAAKGKKGNIIIFLFTDVTIWQDHCIFR